MALAIVAAASGSGGAGPVDALGAAFFVADAALNLRTGYVDAGGTLVLRRGRIARRYALTWLAPDVLGAAGPWLTTAARAVATRAGWDDPTARRASVAPSPRPRKCKRGSRESISVWKTKLHVD